MLQAIRNPQFPGKDYPLADHGDARIGSRPWWTVDAFGDSGSMTQMVLAFLSVTGALVGVMLGSLLNARVQRASWEHQESTMSIRGRRPGAPPGRPIPSRNRPDRAHH